MFGLNYQGMKKTNLRRGYRLYTKQAREDKIPQQSSEKN